MTKYKIIVKDSMQHTRELIIATKSCDYKINFAYETIVSKTYVSRIGKTHNFDIAPKIGTVMIMVYEADTHDGYQWRGGTLQQLERLLTIAEANKAIPAKWERKYKVKLFSNEFSY